MQIHLSARRYCERRRSSAFGRVIWYDDSGQPVERSTDLVDISRLGVRISLIESLDIGQPVSLAIPMPLALRAFDKRDSDYHVWGIVRYIGKNFAEDGQFSGYLIGIALTGSDEPAGYFSDMGKRYDLKPFPSKDGFWQVREVRFAGVRQA